MDATSARITSTVDFPHSIAELFHAVAERDAREIRKLRDADRGSSRVLADEDQALLDAARDDETGIPVMDAKGRILAANRALLAMLGYGRHELVGRSFASIHKEPQTYWGAMERLQAHEASSSYDAFLRAKGGSTRCALIRLTARWSEGKVMGLHGAVVDVTERMVEARRLRYLAGHDTLTGLPNRRLFFEALRDEVARARRDPRHAFAIFFIDLDHLKIVNDSLGHEAGDRMLREVANRLRRTVRSGDTVARLGGDEFAVLLRDVPDEDHVRRKVERMRKLLGTPMRVQRQDVVPSASFGIVLQRGGSESPFEVMRDADAAMYRAKALGRGRYELLSEGAKPPIVRGIFDDVRRAVERRDFLLQLQPMVSLKAAGIAGFEALARLRRADGKLIPGAEFLAAAEESASMREIGLWLVREACVKLADWRRRYPAEAALFVSCNVSRQLLLDAGFVPEVRRMLEQTESPPGALWVEVTESMLLDRPCAQALHALAGVGVRIALDDFGTGHTCLATLGDVPLHALKLAPRFVAGLGQSAKATAVARAVIELGRGFGMTVIGEGVETVGQLEAARSIGCPMVQGFRVARPLCVEAADALLAGKREQVAEILGIWPRETAPPEPQAEHVGPAAHPTVMIVEDDDDLRELLGAVLSLKGYDVMRAADGAEAWHQLKEGRQPSVILLDLMLPVMDGWTFRMRQQRDPLIGRIPVVVLTGAPELIQDQRELDVEEWIGKPVDVDRLVETVKRYC
ncbi:MAG: EAL domain-containing protein [Acidobacteriota bacterium]